MHKLYELKDMLCKELEEYGSKELNVGDLDVIDKLSHAIKNIDKIIEAYDEDGMSYDGGSYEGGVSYRRGGRSNRSYARGRGSNARRDSMGRYSSRGGRSNRSYDDGMSYADGTEEMIIAVKEMMSDLPENAKREAQRFVQKLEQEMM